jgi:hypothetical protein
MESSILSLIPRERRGIIERSRAGVAGLPKAPAMQEIRATLPHLDCGPSDQSGKQLPFGGSAGKYRTHGEPFAREETHDGGRIYNQRQGRERGGRA